jgi:hypothetical protein
MKIWHRGKLTAEHGAFLQSHGISITPIFRDTNPDKPSFYEFIIEEKNQAWPEVRQRLGNGHTYIRTEFTLEEIMRTEWSIVRAVHSIGSVRHGNFAWSEDVFAGQCKSCGTGWRQIAPFRLKKEPKLGTSVFADFGSGFELFCAPTVLRVFQKCGFVGFRAQPLLLDNGQQQSKILEQLLVTEVAGPAVADELVERERYSQTDCLVCGRTWHAHYTRGALPLRRSGLNQDVDFQLTGEWFGNGRTARREILVSRRVVNRAVEEKWEGIEFIPVSVV